MGTVYVIKDGSTTFSMTPIRCTNEDRELQQLLENNHDLLPGDQIDPDNPRRWLLIKREMPVQDPNTGEDRWSIDFFFVDQDAMPTLVECKRFADTRSRREVIGQMLEYAANGHHYWTKEAIREYAEKTAAEKGISIEDAVKSLGPEDADVDAFFEQVRRNLQEGQVRLVFFLEAAPFELRSVVDFLNKQMERSEVLLVEARQYERDGMRIVVPTLFGYTEQARLVKKPVKVIPTGGSRRKWDKASFFAEAEERLDPADLGVVRKLFSYCESSPGEIGWGTGVSRGSFTFKWSVISQKSLVTVTSDGLLTLNFGWLHGDERAEAGRDQLKKIATESLELSVPSNYQGKFPAFSIEQWGPKVDLLTQGLTELLKEHPAEERPA